MLKTHLQYRTVGEVGHHPLFGRASFAAMSTTVFKTKMDGDSFEPTNSFHPNPTWRLA